MSSPIYDPFTIKEPEKSKQRSVPGFSFRQHEGEYFSDDNSETALGLPLNKLYLNMLLYFVMFFALLITIRVGYVQLYKGDHFKKLAQKNSIKVERISAPRGLIYDRSATKLAENHPRFSIKIIAHNLPGDYTKRVAVAEMLKKGLYNMPEYQTTIEPLITQVILEQNYHDPVVTIAENIDHETALYFKLRNDLPGIFIDQGTTREYLYGNFTGHIIGYLDQMQPEEWATNSSGNEYYYGDLVGRVGLEKAYESALRGQDKHINIEVDVRGNEQKIISQSELISGNSLVLTIDLPLQEKLTSVLEKYSARTGNKAAAVALQPKTGELLALVSIPTFDNNSFANRDTTAITELLNNKNQPLFNRAISGMYPPGSTFKPFVALAALEESVVTPSKQFYSNGGIQVNTWFFPDWKTGGHGWTNLTKSIAESVNTYYYIIGGGYMDNEGLGVALINTHAKRFGFGSLVGIDLPNEKSGFLPDKVWKQSAKNEPWYIGDTYHLSIGQGDILVTPLQLAVAYSGIANNGTVLKPFIVKSIITAEGKSITEYSPEFLRQHIAAPEHVSAVQRALRETVLSGSATSLQALPVTAAGKTGTAQIGGTNEPHAWFVGYAPYEQPEIVLAILVENGVSGSLSATPVFREVINWYFTQ